MTERKIKLKHIYRHFKGNFYFVEDVARDSETQSEVVVYCKLYGERTLWVRPREMFLSEVDHKKYPEAVQEYRFQEIDESELTDSHSFNRGE